ncbi:MATE family efflux transporter [Planomicrobium sp. Y74]|uniref:MATE family efflux transporter n=1 Tax=Planomicrobium sp. Y74 TaxID=2478977 RepID=UPI000EF541D5|nr:MATE family efflux transporter [Planomicrobium sp. Y74]RLQ89904.1 MATE family efflux transporter [Planomicrobium sp. Y74]
MNHRTYLALALPLTLSTVTTPLLGAVDTAVMGQLPNPAYIGGVAIGTIIFNTMYWLFGFLRISTSGFAAQAFGANDELQGKLSFIRPFLIALAVGLFFFLLQKPIEYSAMALLNPAADVQTFASEYYGIRIWGVPLTLLNYVILGWLMGMAKIKWAVFIQIMMNVLNIVLDLVFVMGLSWGISGVAAATLIAEFTAFAVGLWVVVKAGGISLNFLPLKQILDLPAMKKMFMVNKDLFIRTICLLLVFNLFTYKSASFGTETLAANAVLLQIHYLMAYFFDGFSNATSILTGKAMGAKDYNLYKRTLSISAQWAILTSAFLTLMYWMFSESVIRLFTTIEEVVEMAMIYSDWLLLFPIATSIGIIFYGTFTGATETAPVRNSMIVSLLFYFLMFYLSVPHLENHGIWLSFIAFSIGRSVFLSLYVPKLSRQFQAL